ncbi:MAG: GPR endopeptidase [Oscillospiraceae bacterium]|nr:GPR endopeptidase [Oscillospiraceae bacterium]
MQRTDLAHEMGVKPGGNYDTLFCDELDSDSEISALSKIISRYLPVKQTLKTLVVGLGNENITPDSLGARAAGRVLATAHFTGHSEFDELGLREVYVITPGVMAQTGFESAEQLKYIVNGVKPDCLIVIDSLACRDTGRLGHTIQVTDTGISPGSGVKNERREFSEKTFGIPIIAVGVPTVVDLTISDEETFMAVPRDIDVIVNHFARVISGAVNKALNPTLSESEIEKLLF